MYAITPNIMTDIKARFKPLFRRTPTHSSAKSSASSLGSPRGEKRSRSKGSQQRKSRKPSVGNPVQEEEKESTAPPTADEPGRDDSRKLLDVTLETPRSALSKNDCPVFTLETPTPDPLGSPKNVVGQASLSEENLQHLPKTNTPTDKLSKQADGAVPTRPEPAPRRQSLAHSSQTKFLKTLLEADKPQSRTPNVDYFGGPPTISANMLHRKIWVKRPGSSATLVSIKEDDLVDDVREMILKKYANSLGRSYDAPDVTLRIVPREPSHRLSQGGERTLGPEEPITRTLDAYFPGGQNVDEALLIDVPQRRTPRHSPRNAVPYYLAEDLRPGETGTDYFPPMPANGQHSPHLQSNLSITSGQSASHHSALHSSGVLNSGQVPPLPSPGLRASRHPQHTHRPKYGRQHTSSPTVISGATGSQNLGKFADIRSNIFFADGAPEETLKSHPTNVPLASSGPATPISSDAQPHRTATPPPRPPSPRPKVPHKRSKKAMESHRLPTGLLDGAVPPINVLIVEDNIINLKLLEAFMKRLKVRWHTAMNGRDAVTKWRAGGFHLVLMDIQLPVMNGLEATKEIRRLERLNNIGVFSNSASNTPILSPGSEKGNVENTESVGNSGPAEKSSRPDGDDSLMNTGLFKSPVIIVALTASSLQSDRHEALAAGCNDFLTKVRLYFSPFLPDFTSTLFSPPRNYCSGPLTNSPINQPVNFVWLERKVMEWGCMQALIDFDGWRKWKDFSQQTQSTSSSKTTSNHAHKASGVGAVGPTKGLGAGGVNSGGSKSGISPTTARRDKRLSGSTAGTAAGTLSGSSDMIDEQMPAVLAEA